MSSQPNLSPDGSSVQRQLLVVAHPLGQEVSDRNASVLVHPPGSDVQDHLLGPVDRLFDLSIGVTELGKLSTCGDQAAPGGVAGNDRRVAGGARDGRSVGLEGYELTRPTTILQEPSPAQLIGHRHGVHRFGLGSKSMMTSKIWACAGR